MMEEKDEILFKGKRIDTGDLVEGYLYKLSEDTKPFIMLKNRHGEGYQVEPETVCRYTGLIDKNGKRVFEADKLQDKYGNTGIVKFGYQNCGCCYDVYGFAVDGLEEWINEDVIVIGNIFDKEDKNGNKKLHNNS